MRPASTARKGVCPGRASSRPETEAWSRQETHRSGPEAGVEAAAPQEAQEELPREVPTGRGVEEAGRQQREGGDSDRGTPRQAGEPSDQTGQSSRGLLSQRRNGR